MGFNIQYEYSGLGLDEHLKQLDYRINDNFIQIQAIKQQLDDQSKLLEAIKRIVPLVDEDLGNHEAPSTAVE